MTDSSTFSKDPASSTVRTSSRGASTNPAVVGNGWGTATIVEAEPGNASEPRVVMDGSGNALAVWSQFDGARFNAWGNRYDVQTGWGTATPIETYDAGNATVSNVAMDGSGNAMALGTQFDGASINAWANRYDVKTGWGPATLIEAEPGNASQADVAMDGSGNAMAVGRHFDGATINVWANRYDVKTGWGTATLIDAVRGYAFGPRVAMDGSGNATAVWYQFFDGGCLNIYANRYVVGTGWGTATLIETDFHCAFEPRVAMDADGNAVAVWEQYDGPYLSIYANRYVVGTGWATGATLIETDNENALDPQVAVDPSGNAVAVWAQYNRLFANRYAAGKGWGMASLIGGDDAGGAYEPDVAMDASGNAVVVWSQSIRGADGLLLNSWANRYNAACGWWGTPVLFETDPGGVGGTHEGGALRVAMDGSSNAIAVWSQFDGTRWNIWANRYVADTISPSLIVTSPTASLTNSASAVVAGTTEPGASVTVNGASVAVDTSGAFSTVLSLAEGLNTIIVVAKDGACNAATVVRSITRDSAPVVSVTSPAQDATTSQPTALVAGTVDDATATVLVNALQVRPDASGRWSVTLALLEGDNTIVVSAIDAAGNRGPEVSRTVTYTSPLPGLESALQSSAQVTEILLIALIVVPVVLVAVQVVLYRNLNKKIDELRRGGGTPPP